MKAPLIDSQTAMSLGVFLALVAMFGSGLYWAGEMRGRQDATNERLARIENIEIEKRLTRIETKIEKALTLRTTTTPTVWPLTLRLQSELWLPAQAWP